MHTAVYTELFTVRVIYWESDSGNSYWQQIC